ncbi:MAG: CDP-diacylglycerol--glycerol-3-phosphate 3-phosphatidyltransferase [Acidobacteria bacterium RIFCSPLOWO2_12_FULL_54_10]|nr:MAG: CDP-diacylglycerol--glycerol-3-phosphate 3-phosphatidyltransferase [Acidobacteria bacterium RIFCSPLOWO2_12_FULL_54_10]
MTYFKQVFYAPNQITLLRLILIPFVILAILYQEYPTAFGLVLLGGISDGVDGMLARRLGQQTALGTFLDPIADKLLLTSAFITLQVAGLIPLWLLILILSRDVLMLITALVIILTTSLKNFPPSYVGKISTMFQIATVLLTLLVQFEPVTWVHWLQNASIYVTAALTIASGLHYTFRTADRLRNIDRA